MSTGRLFIIGIDGVDLAVARDHDLLLQNTVEWDLKEYPKLHTLRIWPSMFLGDLPHKNDDLPDPIAHSRSDRDEERLERANWTSSGMRILSKISHLLLPESIRTPIGAFLRDRGFTKAHHEREDWPNTVFDGVQSKAINLPTYNPLPVQHELKQGWKTRIREGDAGLEELEELAQQERDAVAEELDTVLNHGYDLVWAYVFCTDIFGHLDYEYGYPRTVERVRDEVIDPVREQLDDDDELVIVTDHGMGLEDGVGEHRPPGWLTTTVPDTDLPASPERVRFWIETFLGDRSQQKEDVLEDLGYI
ncbi:hypothetical protein [Halovenus halobia]|uniref:hypothetical protein n=1 Tax=Halovenus halobia TaxID=3396622 RepID=UPI003F5799DE